MRYILKKIAKRNSRSLRSDHHVRAGNRFNNLGIHILGHNTLPVGSGDFHVLTELKIAALLPKLPGDKNPERGQETPKKVDTQ